MSGNEKVLISLLFDADTVLKIDAAANAEARTKFEWIKRAIQKELGRRRKDGENRPRSFFHRVASLTTKTKI